MLDDALSFLHELARPKQKGPSTIDPSVYPSLRKGGKDSRVGNIALNPSCKSESSRLGE